MTKTKWWEETISVSWPRPTKSLAPNETLDWLVATGRQYLASAAQRGDIAVMTAFRSALDRRPLGERVAAWDAARAAFKPQITGAA